MSSFEALTADVTWRANTGEVERDVERLRREFHQATAGMSDDTLRLAAAQDRLDRALAKHGPQSRQARDAELGLRRAMRETEQAAQREAAALDRTQREMGQVARGAAVGSGALRGLGRSALFMSTTFLGSAGVVYALRSTLDAAKESQVVLGQTANAVKRAGLDWDTYSDQVQNAALAVANVSGFDDERLLRTFSLLVRRTKDVNEALKLNALAADIARGRNIELEAAANLVLKASIGQAGALRRLGIDAKQGSDAVALLALLQKSYAGSAEAYGKTAAGAQDRFNVALQNTQELIGAALLPTVTKYLDKGATWLSDSKNQERIQRDVNEALKDGAQVAHGLADGLDDIHDVAAPLVDLVGGLKNAVELLLIAMAVGKVSSFATALGLVGPAATTAATGVAAAETAIGATTAVAGGASLASGAAIATTRVTALRTALTRLGAIGAVTVGIDLVINRKQVADELDKAGLGFLRGPTEKGLIDIIPGADKSGIDLLKGLFGGGGGALKPSPVDYSSLYAGLKPSPVTYPNRVPSVIGGHTPGVASATQLRAQALALAQTTPGTADDIAALRAQQQATERDIAFWQRRGNTPQAVAMLTDLYGRAEQIRGQLLGIAEDAARKAEQARDKAKAARLKAEKARAEMIANLIPDRLSGRGLAPGAFAAYQAAGAAAIPGVVGGAGTVPADVRKNILAGITGGNEVLRLETELAEAQFATHEEKVLPFLRREEKAKREQIALLKRIGAGDVAILTARIEQQQLKNRIKGITGADVAGGGARASEEQFLSSFVGIQSRYAPNAFPMGSIQQQPIVAGAGETHLYSLVHETRQTNAILTRLAAHEAFPATKQAQSSALAAFG